MKMHGLIESRRFVWCGDGSGSEKARARPFAGRLKCLELRWHVGGWVWFVVVDVWRVLSSRLLRLSRSEIPQVEID